MLLNLKGRKLFYEKLIPILSLSIILILICIPRFNRQDIGFLRHITGYNIMDVEIYSNVVLFLRKAIDTNAHPGAVMAPYTYRLFAPFLASLLPFKPMTALNLINVASLLIAMYFLYFIQIQLKIRNSISLLGCAIFAISFPTFYYGPIGWVDPPAICIIIIGSYFIIRNYLGIASLFLTIGIFCKESTVILLPVLLVYIFMEKQWGKIKKGGLFLMLILYTFGLLLFTRVIAFGGPGYGWYPSFEMLIFNLKRFRAIFTLIISFGLPGMLASFLILRNMKDVKKTPSLAALTVGFASSITLAIYALIAAYSDGRYIWYSYPFSIPLAMFFVNKTRIDN